MSALARVQLLLVERDERLAQLLRLGHVDGVAALDALLDRDSTRPLA